MTGILRATLNKYALGTALALVIAPLTGMESAEAACSPASGQDNVTVTCDSNTTNQDGAVGFGQGTENGVTLTVNSGVTVTGTGAGVNLNNNNVITVQGGATVAATAGNGVEAHDGSTINNAGSISAPNVGILNAGGGSVTLHNSGTISADAGVSSIGGMTVDNSGGITGTRVGLNSSHGAVNVTSNTGTISGAGQGINASRATVANSSNGMIQATGTGGVGIGGFSFNSDTVVTLDNAGSVLATNTGGVAVQGLTVNVNSNTGTISGDVFGINATGTATVKNGVGGTIQALGAGGVAIGDNTVGSTSTVTLDNAGTVSAIGSGGTAVLGQTVNVNSNTGTIQADMIAVAAGGVATVNNAGTISAASQAAILADITANVTNLAGGTIKALGAGGIAIQARTVNVSANAGDIIGDKNAISAHDTANVTNSGNITAIGSGLRNGIAIVAPTVNVTNLAGGVITGGDNGGVGINATGDLVLNNAGKITAAFALFGHDSATITNSGDITGRIGVVTGNLILTNSGSITGTSFDAATIVGDANIVNLAGGTIQGTTFGISTNTLTLVNSGMISGQTAISVSGGATITNFGTIRSTAGATGTAIQLSSAADTLNIKRGSSIIGLIDFGHGADVINVDSTAPQTPKGVSMLSRATSAVVDALRQQLVNFDGIINIIGGNSTSGQPSVTVNGTTASLDPTALAQQDRILMDFTGGMSSMVQGRLGSGGGGAGGAGPQAMSYAMEDARAEIFSKAPAATWSAPVNVWTSAFGGVRSQNGTDTTLDSRSSVAGGAIGVDRRIRPDWLVGLFAGGGSGVLNVDLGSQKVDTDYFSGGAYSRFEWASQFFDATLQVGGVNNRSSRLLQNNITGGLEHASANYNGWFVSPEIAYGYRVDLGNGAVMTPVARVRYVAGFFDGYNENGSAQTLSIGSRTLQDFEERAELEFTKTGFAGDPNLKLSMHGGVIAWQRTGNATINALLIGQNLSFVTPGRSSAVGGVIGAGLDYRVGANVALFGAVEGTLMSDESQVVSAKGGMRVAF